MEFRAEFNRDSQLALFKDFANLQSAIDGFIDIEFGQNIDLENKSNCNAGFIIDFENQSALKRYTQNKQHQKLGTKLVSMCVGGAQGIIVFDLIV